MNPSWRPRRPRWPRWLPWVLAAVGAVVVVVVAGLVVIHLVQGGSKAPLTLPAVTTTSTAAAGSAASTAAASGGAVSVDGAWKVGAGSTAGYRIKETLFGQSNTAVGRTSAVTGAITISGTTVSAGSFSVDMTQVSSDRSQRDQQFQGRIMNTSSFPTATFKLSGPIALSTIPANGVQVSAMASGDLMLHGATKSVSFPVTAQRNGSAIQVQGAIPITFADYNISNPSGGPATTASSGSLEFLLTFTQS